MKKKKKKKKHPIQRVRKSSMTDRDRLSTMVNKDKKKEENKRKCRKKVDKDG
jgi:hypothetical protein